MYNSTLHVCTVDQLPQLETLVDINFVSGYNFCWIVAISNLSHWFLPYKYVYEYLGEKRHRIYHRSGAV